MWRSTRCLIQTLAILAWQEGKAGPWIVLSGLLRYGFVAASWLLPWMRRPLTPTSRARIICVVQTAALVVVLAPGRDATTELDNRSLCVGCPVLLVPGGHYAALAAVV